MLWWRIYRTNLYTDEKLSMKMCAHTHTQAHCHTLAHMQQEKHKNKQKKASSTKVYSRPRRKFISRQGKLLTGREQMETHTKEKKKWKTNCYNLHLNYISISDGSSLCVYVADSNAICSIKFGFKLFRYLCTACTIFSTTYVLSFFLSLLFTMLAYVFISPFI